MIRTDLGIATAYAEAVSKGYTGTRDEFGELLANAVKNAKQVAEDRVVVEAAKKSVDQTVETFYSHVAEKTAEATEAISEHAEVAQTAAENAINDAKDAGVSAVNTASETGVNNVNTAVEEGKKNFETDETLELSGRAADAAVTGEKINDLKKDIYFSKRPIGQAPAIISFIDDDCRIETYNKILPLVKEFKIPLGLACPVGQLGTDTFMSVDQLKEMIAAGATVLSHHQKQYGMSQFQNRTEYENELNRTDAAFKAIGLEPKGICYPNGIYVDNYMDIVKDHYDYGFTVDRGVNTIPLESLFLKRVEVFPTSEIYTFDDVRKYVDNIKDGEWLIFMTHAWYTTFDSAKLTELINYIKSRNIDIVSVDDGMSRIGNLEEYGIIKKPLEYMSEPFYVVDKNGQVHTNNQKFYQKSDKKLTNVTPGWNAGYNLTTSGATPAASSKNRLVSAKATVKPGETYLISASNIYGNALYCIYDSSDTVIAYEASDNTAEGTVITKKYITIPENASYMKIASNIATQPNGYELLKVDSVTVNHDLVDGTLSLEGVPADAKVVGDSVGLLTKKTSQLSDCKISKFYASNQGETHLADSDNGKIQDMVLYGKSEQKQYKGINLLPPDTNRNEYAEVSISKGSIVFWTTDGTPTNGGNFKFFNEDKTESMWFGVDRNATSRIQTLRINAKYVQNLIDKDFDISKICLGVGSEPIYEPYTGGIPSPSPDYPQEIKSVVNPTVKVSSEDETESQTTTLPYTLNAVPVSSGGNVTIDGQQYIADYVDVERGKIIKCVEKYRISSDLNWMYEPTENNRFGAYGLSININPNFANNTLFTHYRNAPNGTGGFISPGNIRLHNFQGFTDVTTFKEWLDKNESYVYFAKNTLEEIDLTIEEIQIFKALSTHYTVTNISVNSEQLDGYTVFNYPISMAEGWNYVKQQINDNRDYIYDMDAKTQDIDIQSAEAYVNSEYAVALTELEVM